MIEHLSYSSISSFLLCPRSWRFKYIDQIPTKPNSNLILGSVFHSTVEYCVTEHTTEDVGNIFKSAWDKKLSESESIDWGDKSPDQVHDDGLRLFSSPEILNGIKKIKPMKDAQDKPLIEKFVKLSVPNVPIPIIGYIDIVLEDGTPADFKTSSKKWTDDQAQNSLQSLFYLAALQQENFPVNWNFKHLVFVKTQKPQFQELEHKHNPAELFFLFDIIESVWRAIEAKVFIPQTDGWKCSPLYCDYWSICKGAVS